MDEPIDVGAFRAFLQDREHYFFFDFIDAVGIGHVNQMCGVFRDRKIDAEFGEDFFVIANLDHFGVTLADFFGAEPGCHEHNQRRRDGNGEITAVASADPKDPQSFKKPEHRTFRGKCIVVIRPTGKAGQVVLQAQGDGLKADKVAINIK